MNNFILGAVATVITMRHSKPSGAKYRKHAQARWKCLASCPRRIFDLQAQSHEPVVAVKWSWLLYSEIQIRIFCFCYTLFRKHDVGLAKDACNG